MREALLGLLVVLAAGLAAAAEAPSVATVLAKVGFSGSDQQRVLSGDFIHRALESTTPRDLAVALAFLVRESPTQFDRQMMGDALLIQKDPDTIVSGALEGEASLASLAALTLSREEREFYATANAGDEVNLSADELAALAKLRSDEKAIDAQMRRILLDRYRAYQSKGLAGIAAYARGGQDVVSPGDELRRASVAARATALFDPSLFSLLQEYPAATPPDLEQSFHWVRYQAHGQPTLGLTHLFTAPVGRAFVFVQRQFYVSRGYNAEQAIAGFLPVKEGTLVVYTNHTYTDQVTGLGGNAKRSIGERLMASQLQTLFEQLRREAKSK